MKLAGIACVLLLSSGNALSQTPGSVASEMTRLSVKVAIILPSESIDDYPLWSADSRYIFANLEPRGWWKVDLSSIVLTSAMYQGRTIAGLAKGSTVAQARADEVTQAKTVSREVKGDLRLSDGTQLSWESRGSFGSRLSIQLPGKAPEAVWETEMTACGYLILSPDKNYVATYCERTGVIVLRLN